MLVSRMLFPRKPKGHSENWLSVEWHSEKRHPGKSNIILENFFSDAWKASPSKFETLLLSRLIWVSPPKLKKLFSPKPEKLLLQNLGSLSCRAWELLYYPKPEKLLHRSLRSFFSTYDFWCHCLCCFAASFIFSITFRFLHCLFFKKPLSRLHCLFFQLVIIVFLLWFLQ